MRAVDAPLPEHVFDTKDIKPQWLIIHLTSPHRLLERAWSWIIPWSHVIPEDIPPLLMSTSSPGGLAYDITKRLANAFELTQLRMDFPTIVEAREYTGVYSPRHYTQAHLWIGAHSTQTMDDFLKVKDFIHAQLLNNFPYTPEPQQILAHAEVKQFNHSNSNTLEHLLDYAKAHYEAKSLADEIKKPSSALSSRAAILKQI